MQLVNSDGVTWVAMTGPSPGFVPGPTLTVTPLANCQAIIIANTSVFTDTTTYNQDVGIYVVGGAFPTTANVPEQWQESASVGTFAPTALAVTKRLAFVGGTAYTITLRWKSNSHSPQLNSNLFAGAGDGTTYPTRSRTTFIVELIY